MLSKLISRLNNDSNKQIEDSILRESLDVNEKIIDEVLDEDVELLQKSLEVTQINNNQPNEMNEERLIESASNPVKAINEAVTNTDSCVSIDKDSYDALIATIDLYKKKSTSDADKKQALKRIKTFVKNVNRSMRKVNDDKPADAMIVAAINKLCKLFDVEPTVDKNATKKYNLAVKINALSKAIK